MLWEQTLKQFPDREQPATRTEPADQPDQHSIQRNAGSLIQLLVNIRAETGSSSVTHGGKEYYKVRGKLGGVRLGEGFKCQDAFPSWKPLSIPGVRD